MDLEMPEMDGFAATQEIRATSGRRGPPILAYTAHALDENRAGCEAAGMDGFLAKPISSEDLIREVERWPRRSDG
jgi:CheY-like chemotaxis protein